MCVWLHRRMGGSPLVEGSPVVEEKSCILAICFHPCERKPVQYIFTQQKLPKFNKEVCMGVFFYVVTEVEISCLSVVYGTKQIHFQRREKIL